MSWHVLLVEDDDDIREALGGVLSTRGYRVTEARHGGEALELVRRTGLRPAVIVLDLMMPVMDGIAFLEAQADEPLLEDVPVVILTARGSSVAGMPTSVRAVLAKPTPLPRLLDLIAKVCGEVKPPRVGRIAKGSSGLVARDIVPEPGEDRDDD